MPATALRALIAIERLPGLAAHARRRLLGSLAALVVELGHTIRLVVVSRLAQVTKQITKAGKLDMTPQLHCAPPFWSFHSMSARSGSNTLKSRAMMYRRAAWIIFWTSWV